MQRLTELQNNLGASFLIARLSPLKHPYGSLPKLLRRQGWLVCHGAHRRARVRTQRHTIIVFMPIRLSQLPNLSAAFLRSTQLYVS